MKKIIIAFLSFTFLFVGQSAFASGPFNGQSGDCPNMGIGVYPNNIQRDNYGCWTATSVSASDGDTVNVSMWYHNNTTSTLNNVRASLSQSSTGPTTNYTFSGNMYSSQGNTSLGTVSLNLSNSQTLTYQSANWMKDKQAIDSDTDTSLLSMSHGSQATLGNGNVPPGWNDYGQIIIVFKVGNSSNHNDNCTISNFTADGSSTAYVDSGDAVDLDWDTDNCTSASITSLGNVSLSGSDTVYPNYDRTYTLTAHGSSGSSVTRSVYVNVDDNNNTDSCEIIDFYANPTSITSGQAVTLTWNTDNCDYVNISSVGSNLPTSYSRTIYPTNTTTYNLRAYGDGNDPSDSVTVRVNDYVQPYIPPYIPPVYNNCAVTTIATNVGTNSATLNGIANNSSNSYFEYGKTVSMGNITNSRSGNIINETITGLSSNTIYFYRLVSNCGNAGISRGSIEVFQTNSNQTTTTKTVYVQGTTVVGTSSPIMLKIENRYKSIRVGDNIDYTITYKNIGNRKLTKSLLQVILPKGISFLNSSDGTYVNDNRTLTLYLGDLDIGEDGVLYVQGKVSSLSRDNAEVVTTALLVYTSSKGAQENAIAYVLNNPNYNGNNSLTGAAFFAGFWGMGIIGWLLLIIIILLIILLVRRYYYTRDDGTYGEIHH